MSNSLQLGRSRLGRSGPHLFLALALTAAAGCHHHHTNTVAQQAPELKPEPQSNGHPGSSNRRPHAPRASLPRRSRSMA